MLQDLFGERGVRDFGSSQCCSATELQLHLLDLPLDQFVEGSDVRKLLDLSPSLAALNFRLVMRLVNFVVGVIFAQERCWFGSPKIRDGPIALRLPNSRFVHRLRMLLGPLESDDLYLELAVELLQRLMFMHDVLAIESCLLPTRSDRAWCSIYSFMLASI